MDDTWTGGVGFSTELDMFPRSITLLPLRFGESPQAARLREDSSRGVCGRLTLGAMMGREDSMEWPMLFCRCFYCWQRDWDVDLT